MEALNCWRSCSVFLSSLSFRSTLVHPSRLKYLFFVSRSSLSFYHPILSIKNILPSANAHLRSTFSIHLILPCINCFVAPLPFLIYCVTISASMITSFAFGLVSNALIFNFPVLKVFCFARYHFQIESTFLSC
jgi:hypothetical protein